MGHVEVTDADDASDTRKISVQALLGIIVAIFTVISLIFTAGVEWNKVSEVGAKEAGDFEAVQRDYVRKDVQAEQMRTLETKLDEINRQLYDVIQARTTK